MSSKKSESTGKTGLLRHLTEIASETKPPTEGMVMEPVHGILNTLSTEPDDLRPEDSGGNPGGVIKLKDLPTVILPDLHARRDFIMAVLASRPDGTNRVIDLLNRGEIQIVCVGDGFHAEARARERWAKAFMEFKTGYRQHKAMDKEMTESLGLMRMIMELKIHYPDNFHFLKGNHENIANEQGEGNYPFGKFAYEGEMVRTYMERFYSRELFLSYYRFEKLLPLLTIGKNFVVSHAEPQDFFPIEEVINYRYHPEVIYGLTWTADDASKQGSVKKMLHHYLGRTEKVYYFGGHRPVRGAYNLRAEGQYVQLHNPDEFVLTWLDGTDPINLEESVKIISKRGWKGELE